MTLIVLDFLARGVHILGVVIWMGHNYANVVRNPVYKRPQLDAAADAFAAASKREHAIFRHSSIVTLITGLYMLWSRDILLDTLTLSGHSTVRGIGVWTGLLMVANLWFVLWPHQKKVLGYVPATVEERLRCSRITFLSSRTNTVLSVPTLFLMVASTYGTVLID